MEMLLAITTIDGDVVDVDCDLAEIDWEDSTQVAEFIKAMRSAVREALSAS